MTTVIALVENGADVKHDGDGHTTLHNACRGGCSEVLCFF